MPRSKKNSTPSRPPRSVWIVLVGEEKTIGAATTSKASAEKLIESVDDRVVGPYVLAERVREK